MHAFIMNCKKKKKKKKKKNSLVIFLQVVLYSVTNSFVIFFSLLCISSYLSYNKLCWIRLRILPYFLCDLFVLREFKGKMIYVRLSEAN